MSAMAKFLSPLDIAALAFFVVAWAGYAMMVEHPRHGHGSLNDRMNRYRELWVRRILAREMRMVDMQIMASLQNGTAFFASTSLIALGGALAILRSTDEIIAMVSTLPFAIETTRATWEAKVIGLAIIFAYAFFKFGWSYRMFNYVVILLGAMPFAAEKDTAEAETHVARTARLFEAAGRHFNRGQRAIFFALGYLGWFIGPVALMVTTAAVVITMWRRQFASAELRAVESE
jgi:uncharacterized membrane protein